MLEIPVRGDREAFALGTMAGIDANIATVLVVHRMRAATLDVVANQAMSSQAGQQRGGDRTFAKWRSSSGRLRTFALAPGMVCGGGSARLVVVSGGADDAVVSAKLPFASERGGQNCLHGRQNYLAKYG